MVWNATENENKKFVKVTKRDFVKFQNHCMNVWQWSPNRIRRVKSTLSSLSQYIEDILDDEPGFRNYRAVVNKVKNPVKTTVRDKTVFEPEELQHLLDTLVEREMYLQACVLALAMYSGRRKAELPRFKTNFFKERNVIFGSLYKTPEKVRTKGRGTHGKMLDLYVLKKDFDPYLKLWMDERKKLGIDSVWLFPYRRGNRWSREKPMKVDTLNSWVPLFSSIVGKDFYWHSLRHFFTTQCFKANLPSEVIQEIVGWDSVDMCQLYNDTSTEETLAKYFDENGIKKVEQSLLSDL